MVPVRRILLGEAMRAVDTRTPGRGAERPRQGEDLSAWAQLLCTSPQTSWRSSRWACLKRPKYEVKWKDMWTVNHSLLTFNTDDFIWFNLCYKADNKANWREYLFFFLRDCRHTHKTLLSSCSKLQNNGLFKRSTWIPHWVSVLSSLGPATRLAPLESLHQEQSAE